MIWAYYLLLQAVVALGLMLVIVTLPGLWLITAAAAAYAIVTHHRHLLGIETLLVLLGLTLVAEFVELFLTGFATRRAGGGKSAMTAATVGAVAGGIFLSFIPIPIVGTLMGICLGAFVGAAGAEMLGGRRIDHSIGVGLSAVKGRLMGVAAKVAFGFVMWIIILWMAWP